MAGCARWAWVAAAGVACARGDGSLKGDGAGDRDVRFISDVYAWTCQDSTTGDLYQGVFGQRLTLEHAPDALSSLDAPGAGACTAGRDMFPTSAGPGGEDPPGAAAAPAWSAGTREGVLTRLGAGFYADAPLEDQRTCIAVDELLAGGAVLADAGGLDGLQTPAPAPIPEVAFSGLSVDAATGASYLAWGDGVTAEWGENGWDAAWVQVRREREGEAWESVTCGVGDGRSFTMEDDIWALMDERIEVEQNQLYVAFQKEDESTLPDGRVAVTVTRAMVVAVVAD
jgi:hypothetical protein